MSDRADSIRELENLFTSPPGRYRGIPFWSWNAVMEAGEVSRQIRDMHAHGMGGFFIHSREGLETEYLGSGWMASVREAVKTAGELGMSAWLYDEDRWPSGAAGGMVTAGAEEYGSKALVLETAASLEEFTAVAESGNILFAFRARFEPGGREPGPEASFPIPGAMLKEAVRIPETPPARGENPLLPPERYLLFLRHAASPIPWYNGAPPPDNLNPLTVKRFLELTYRAYAEEVGAEFGRTVAGIFTDEPNVSHGHFDLEGKAWIPWTDGLPAFFLERRGRDIGEAVPWMFFEGGSTIRSRHDFWRTIGELFLRSYTLQIHEWCAAHGLPFTGHFLAEGDLGMAVARGGFVMPHYLHLDIPGIDILGSGTGELLTVKQCTSTANQFGRQVLTETYGGAGWEITIGDQKRSGDWQAVLGVTMRSQHLALYSLAGARKRDFPPSFMAHNPCWRYIPALEDYFSRLCAVLAAGKADREILVLHPLATVWSMVGALSGRGYAGLGIREANREGERLSAFCAGLLEEHHDFDFGDETILEEHGRAENGRLQVGEASYTTVILPPGTRSLSASTMALLAPFTGSGGNLVAFSPLPDRIDGDSPAEDPDGTSLLSRLFSGPNVHIPAGSAALFPLLGRITDRVRVTSPTGAEEPAVYCSTRKLPGCRVVFLVNTDPAAAKDITVSLPGQYTAEEWDPLTGERSAIETELHTGDSALADGGSGNRTLFHLQAGPAASLLVVLADAEGGSAAPPRTPSPGTRLSVSRVHRTGAGTAGRGPRNVPSAEPAGNSTFPGPSFAFSRTGPNVLVLDECSWRTGGGTFSRRLPVWKAQDELRTALGMRSITRNSAEQRYTWTGRAAPSAHPAGFQFEFRTDLVPVAPVRLLAERQEGLRITLNGRPQGTVPDGTYLDRSFLTYPLEHLEAGLNTLLLEFPYTEKTEFENCFLLGDFGVSRDGRITGEPEFLFYGDWCLQGYPHYAGSMIYRFSCTPRSLSRRVFLSPGEFRAAAAEVRVNGSTAGSILWKSRSTVELTGLLVPGGNGIELELTGSLRNMLGPLRYAGQAPAVTGWPAFITEGDMYAAHPVLVPYGLYGQVCLEEEVYRG